jgi:membrane fusion protein, multidrug efflux system
MHSCLPGAYRAMAFEALESAPIREQTKILRIGGDFPRLRAISFQRCGGCLLTALLLIAGCRGADEAPPAEERFARSINVETLVIRETPFTERLRLTGTTAAHRDVTVAAEESGVVRETMAEKGTAVKAGQPLIRIDDRVLRAETERARAQAALAAETWERRRRLYEEDRVGSELAYLEARSQAEQTAALLKSLEERLNRTTVRAPITGLLEDRPVEVGSLVAPGAPVARIVQIDPVKVTAGVPERHAPRIRPGGEVDITFDVLPGENFSRPIEYVGSTVDPRNRTFTIEITIPNPRERIKPEMIANLEVVLGARAAAIVVPQEALVRVEEGFIAFVVEDEGATAQVSARLVTLGPAQRNLVVIEQGLSPGDRLVVVGQRQLAAGDRVQVVREHQGENK